MALNEKKPIETTEQIKVTHIGPVQPFRYYLFADVWEELVYYASQKDAWGLFSGQRYRLPLDKLLPNEAPAAGKLDKPRSDSDMVSKKVDSRLTACEADYVEIASFSDVYPCEDALDYAAYLRKVRNIRNKDDSTVGPVCLTAKKHEIMLEDLLLMRSCFASDKQAVFFISADRKAPRAFVLDETIDHLVEVGFEFVREAGSELPFDIEQETLPEA